MATDINIPTTIQDINSDWIKYVVVDDDDEGTNKSFKLVHKAHYGHRGRAGQRGGSRPSTAGTAEKPFDRTGLDAALEPGTVGYILNEVDRNDYTREVFLRWGHRKTVPQSQLSDDEMTELRELFDIGVFDTDGKVYFRTVPGTRAWNQFTDGEKKSFVLKHLGGDEYEYVPDSGVVGE